MKLNSSFYENDIYYFTFFATYIKIPGDSSESYRIIIAFTEKEIHNIKQTCVFSGYKTGFVRLGHNYVYFFSKIKARRKYNYIHKNDDKTSLNVSKTFKF